jgi:hypothetical protein
MADLRFPIPHDGRRVDLVCGRPDRRDLPRSASERAETTGGDPAAEHDAMWPS